MGTSRADLRLSARTTPADTCHALMLDLVEAVGGWHLLRQLRGLVGFARTYRHMRVPPCGECGAPAWTADLHRNAFCRACASL
jgi:hypothetical protein